MDLLHDHGLEKPVLGDVIDIALAPKCAQPWDVQQLPLLRLQCHLLWEPASTKPCCFKGAGSMSLLSQLSIFWLLFASVSLPAAAVKSIQPEDSTLPV